MRVGVDARLLSEPVTGIGRYTSEMLRELIRLPDDYRVYTPGGVRAESLVGYLSDATVRSSRFHSRLGRMAWSQTLLPYWARQDAVDVFWGPTHRLPRLVPSATARVVTIHDLVWKFAGETMRPLSRWLDQHLMPQAIRLANRIVAVSSSTAQAIEEEFPESRGRVRVIHLGPTRFPGPQDRSSLERLGIDCPYILFVGTLEPRKNLPRLLKAFSTLDYQARQAAKLVITGGSGWGNTDIASIVAQLKIADRVVLTGYVSDTELATLYAHARFLAMPSLYEGFGLPIIEAMSFGVPVLTSNLSSMPEVAGDAGLQIDPLDEESIAAGVQALVLDDALVRTLSGHARANAARFSWTRAAQQMRQTFLEALSDS